MSMLTGLGCDVSTVIGTDCDSFWYYTWPPCWNNSRSQWAAVCANTPDTSGGNADCSSGTCVTPNNWGSIAVMVAVVLGVAYVLPSLIGKRK